MAGDANLVIVGRISGLQGLSGWVKAYSQTEPRENILNYSTWRLRLEDQWLAVAVMEGRCHGKGIIVRLGDCADRDTARKYLGADIAIFRSQMPELGPEEYYWTDLVSLQVVTQQGINLGRVDYLLETGSNDVLVVRGERERLIPFLPEDVSLAGDLEHGVIRVDWDPDF